MLGIITRLSPNATRTGSTRQVRGVWCPRWTKLPFWHDIAPTALTVDAGWHWCGCRTTRLPRCRHCSSNIRFVTGHRHNNIGDVGSAELDGFKVRLRVRVVNAGNNDTYRGRLRRLLVGESLGHSDFDFRQRSLPHSFGLYPEVYTSVEHCQQGDGVHCFRASANASE